MDQIEPICEVVVTAPPGSDTRRMVEAVVSERLAACAQRTEQVESTFTWKGRIDSETEARIRFHTRAALFEELAARIERLHPYEVPCILSLPVQAASPAYHRWVLEETKAPS